MRMVMIGLAAIAVAGPLVAARAAGTAPAAQGRSAQIADAMRCDPLPASAPVATRADGSRQLHIRFPDSDPVAILTVPRGAVRQPTIFTLSAPAGTERVLVRIDARDESGNPVTDFGAQPLGLDMHLRSGCTPRRPPTDRQSFYIFLLDPSDSTLSDPRGEWDDASLIQRTPRVRAQLDHLSGYIIAQGAKPPP